MSKTLTQFTHLTHLTHLLHGTRGTSAAAAAAAKKSTVLVAGRWPHAMAKVVVAG